MKAQRIARLAAAAAVPVLVLTGCSKADRAASQDSGEGVATGATAEEYQEALGDMEPVELSYQTSAASETSTSGQRDAAWAADVEEWSGGKIKIDVVYGNAIAPPDEISAALADGRIDMAHWLTSYHADEMKAFTDLQNSLVTVPSSPVIGEIATHFVAQEVAFNTPEVMEEFEAQGMEVLNPFNTFGNTVLACTDEKNQASDFDGNQVRANAQAQSDQIDALGGSTVTMQLAETYEGLQRNVIQCTFGSSTAMVSYGWLETAGNVYVPRDSSFVVGPGSIVAGSSWQNLPLAAQQLIYDRMVTYNSGELGQAFVASIQAAEASKESGSGMHYLDDESSEAIAEGNEKILDSVRASENLDGEKLVSDVEASAEKWQQIADELGYTEEGDYMDFPEWYQGNGEVSDDEYLGPIAERFYEEVLAAHRPE